MTQFQGKSHKKFTGGKRVGKYPRIPWKDGMIYDIEAEIHKTTLIKAIERKLL